MMRMLLIVPSLLAIGVASATAQEAWTVAGPGDGAVPVAQDDAYPEDVIVVEGGVRYWFSTGTSSKDLYGGGDMVSRLTYDGLNAHSGELYGRVGTSVSGFYVRGNAGVSIPDFGTLQDEDFEPLTSPYSSTDSILQDGWLSYVNADVGYELLNTPDLRVGPFVGIAYMKEEMSAYGCQQTATNPFICSPTIGADTLVIQQQNDWSAIRLGISAETRIGDRFTLGADAAYLLTSLNGTDHHVLRPDIDPLPEDGTGQGFQLEARAGYAVTDNVDIGVGARYWHFESEGYAHFEDTWGGGMAQPENWKSDRYGVFVDVGAHF